MKKWINLGIVLIAISVGLALPVDPQLFVKHDAPARQGEEVTRMDLSSFADVKLEQELNLLFIHHSCGGQWLADAGKDMGEHCIYVSHPNGGGLRRLLQENGYTVNEASYGSAIGEETDVFDWLPKFKNQMADILTCSQQNGSLPEGEKNDIVMFKSCYPNNNFKADGAAPGKPAGPELTLWNAMAGYKALLNEFAKHPETLFVSVTAPPIAPKQKSVPLWKAVARKVLGKGVDLEERAERARRFNNWLVSTNGWLDGYEGTNVAVFDYYDILTNEGQSNLSAYPTGDGFDSHPSREGNEKAASALVPFMNRAVRRAGLCPVLTQK